MEYDKIIEAWAGTIPTQVVLRDPNLKEPAFYYAVFQLRNNMTREQFRSYYKTLQKQKPKGALILQLQSLRRYVNEHLPAEKYAKHPFYKCVDGMIEKLKFQLDCWTVETIRTSNECIAKNPLDVMRERYTHPITFN